MSELKNYIMFDNNYPKLHNQKTARLLACFNGITGDVLKEKFDQFLIYDTFRDDGKFYGVDFSKEYILLLFVGDKNILFSTFRKANNENINKYNDTIGEEFNIIIMEDK